MKLWIVVYILNQTASTIGPLPYDMIECQQRVLVKRSEVDAAFRLHGNVLPPMGGVTKEVRPEDVRIECVESPERPKLGE